MAEIKTFQINIGRQLLQERVAGMGLRRRHWQFFDESEVVDMPGELIIGHHGSQGGGYILFLSIAFVTQLIF